MVRSYFTSSLGKIGAGAFAVAYSCLAAAQPVEVQKAPGAKNLPGTVPNVVFGAPLSESTVQVSENVSFSFMLDTDQAGVAEGISETSGQWLVGKSLALRAGVGFTNPDSQIDCSNSYCVGASIASDDPTVESYSVGANWQASERISVDLNLYSQPLDAALGGQSFWRGEFVELDLTQSEGVDLGLICDFSAGRIGDLELGLQLSHIDEQNDFFQNNPFASASLGLGWRRGTLRGDLTSRLLGSINDDNDFVGSWTTYDISFGWRTPWNANLSVGAKNVLDTPAPDTHLLNNRNIDDLFGRVPYVRYQQDL